MKIMEKEKEALGEKEEERVGLGMEARERGRGRDSVEQHPFTNLVFTTAPNEIKFPAEELCSCFTCPV